MLADNLAITAIIAQAVTIILILDSIS